MAFSPLLAAQTPGKSVAAKAQTAKFTRTLDPRDLSGIRFHRIDRDHLAIDFTFQDQRGLTQPFTYKRVYPAHPDWEITEYFCTMEDMQGFYRKVMRPAGKGQ